MVFVRGMLDQTAVNAASAQLLVLARTDPQRAIEVYLDSGGGPVVAGFALYDLLQSLGVTVSTTCLGTAAGPGILVVAGGGHGIRFGLPSSRFRIRQRFEATVGVDDVQAAAREQRRLRERFTELLARHTGRPVEQIAHDVDHGDWLTAAEAREYGLIDAIVPVTGHGQVTGDR